MTETCPTCGKEYKRVTMHWRRSDCEYPSISERQGEIIRGCLMGDGHMDFKNKSPVLHITNTNQEFLDWLECELGILVSHYTLHSTGEQQSNALRESGMGEFECQDVYRLTTRTLPPLEQYSHWYGGGGRRFPDDLQLTPLSLKVWYCCDGTLTKYGSIRIGVKNEMERGAFLRDLFTQFNVSPTISGWNLCLDVEQSVRVFEAMGEPLPGMEYKWP